MKYEITAKRLREALLNAHISQQELSDKTGINKSSISQYINGKNIPGNVKAGKIGLVLGVDPLWLMGLDESVDSAKSLSVAQKRLISEILTELSRLTSSEMEEVKNHIQYLIFKKNN